jgi:hypothetical protein
VTARSRNRRVLWQCELRYNSLLWRRNGFLMVCDIGEFNLRFCNFKRLWQRGVTWFVSKRRGVVIQAHLPMTMRSLYLPQPVWPQKPTSTARNTVIQPQEPVRAQVPPSPWQPEVNTNCLWPRESISERSTGVDLCYPYLNVKEENIEPKLPWPGHVLCICSICYLAIFPNLYSILAINIINIATHAWTLD